MSAKDKINKIEKELLKEAIQALRVIYFVDQEVESFDDYEDLLQGVINCDRVKRLIGEVPEEYIKH